MREVALLRSRATVACCVMLFHTNSMVLSPELACSTSQGRDSALAHRFARDFASMHFKVVLAMRGASFPLT
jgi:hypothetical protein